MSNITGTVRVTGTITPTNTLDTFATHDALFGKGGWRNVELLADLHAITAERRRKGMIVGVDEDSKNYQLNAEPWAYDMTDWTEFSLGGGEGNTVIIQSGVTITIPVNKQSVTYYSVLVMDGGTLIIDGELVVINGVVSVEAGGDVQVNGSLTYVEFVEPSTAAGTYEKAFAIADWADDGSGQRMILTIPNTDYGNFTIVSNVTVYDSNSDMIGTGVKRSGTNVILGIDGTVGIDGTALISGK